MSVKRYDSNGFESEYGIWVRAVDYDALVEQHSKSGGSDTARLDWLEHIAWEPHKGSIALAIFPFTRDARNFVSLAHVDEFGEETLEEFIEAGSLRAAIDAAMIEPPKPGGTAGCPECEAEPGFHSPGCPLSPHSSEGGGNG